MPPVLHCLPFPHPELIFTPLTLFSLNLDLMQDSGEASRELPRPAHPRHDSEPAFFVLAGELAGFTDPGSQIFYSFAQAFISH